MQKWTKNESKKTFCNDDFGQKCKKKQKSSVIHVKNENLMSDKRLSWMCFQGDFGLVFEVHFGVGCLS